MTILFARFNGLTSMKTTSKLTSTFAVLTISVITANSAHAETYCKSVDQNGDATYTLAPDTGCNKKKSKAVGVRQFVAPAGTSTSTTNTESNKLATDLNNAPTAGSSAPAPSTNNPTAATTK